MAKQKREPWNPLLCNYPDSKKVNSVSFEAETLFTRLIAKCDDGANFDGNSTLIMCKLFAERMKNKQVSERKIAKWVQELVKAQLILLYSVGKETYIHVKKCKKHLRKDINPDVRFPAYYPENQDKATPATQEAVTNTDTNTLRTRNENVSSTTDTTTDTTTDNKYCQNSDEFRLASLLLDEIKKSKPDFKEPNLQTWSSHIDKMIRLDNRTPTRIEAVIKWCQQDDFWQSNILSTNKLRKQFDRLEMQKDAKSKRTGNTNSRPSLNEQRWDEELIPTS